MDLVTRKIEKLEKKIMDFRKSFYTHHRPLALVSIVSLAITFLCFLALFIKKTTPPLCYACPLLLCFLWSGYIGYKTLQRPRKGVEITRDPPTNLNVYMLWKTLGQVAALTFFTYIESHLKDKNQVLAICLCSTFYMHLVLVMVIFRIHEDYDVTAGFLAATFELFYESSEGWETFLLIGVTAGFCSLKNILIGGRSSVQKKRPGSKMRSAVIEMRDFPPVPSDLERMLAKFRTYFYGHNDMLAASTGASFLIGYSCLVKMMGGDIVKYYYVLLVTTLLVWGISPLLYCSNKRRSYVAEVVEIRVYHNVHTLFKSVMQVLSLALFTFIDGLLEESVFAVGFCISAYIHFVLLMVVLRIKEDFDVVNGFFAAAFGILYKSSTGLNQLYHRLFDFEEHPRIESALSGFILLLGFVILGCLKNYIVGGKEAGILDDQDLPQESDRRIFALSMRVSPLRVADRISRSKPAPHILAGLRACPRTM